MRDIIIAGYAGETGAAALAKAHLNSLSLRYREDYCRRMTELYACQCGSNAIAALMEEIAGGHTMIIREIGESGVLPGLYSIAEELRCGCRIEKKKIPVRQTSVEICELTGTDPYRMSGRGCILICPEGMSGIIAAEKFRTRGIPAGCIGYLCEGHDKLIVDDPERTEYINRN